MLQSQISIDCRKGGWLHFTGWSCFRFSPCSSLFSSQRNYSVFMQHFPVQLMEQLVCPSGDSAAQAQEVFTWISEIIGLLKQKGSDVVMRCRAKEVRYATNSLTKIAVVIIFSNALLSSVGFPFLCLCIHLGEKKQPWEECNCRCWKIFLAYCLTKILLRLAKNNQRWELICFSFMGGCSLKTWRLLDACLGSPLVFLMGRGTFVTKTGLHKSSNSQITNHSPFWLVLRRKISRIWLPGGWNQCGC